MFRKNDLLDCLFIGIYNCLKSQKNEDHPTAYVGNFPKKKKKEPKRIKNNNQ
jgi:hypothetical protein